MTTEYTVSLRLAIRGSVMQGEGGNGDGNGNKGVRRGTATVTKRAMATTRSVAGNKDSAGDGDCICDSN
jgi:hypothetical protein